MVSGRTNYSNLFKPETFTETRIILRKKQNVQVKLRICLQRFLTDPEFADSEYLYNGLGDAFLKYDDAVYDIMASCI